MFQLQRITSIPLFASLVVGCAASAPPPGESPAPASSTAAVAPAPPASATTPTPSAASAEPTTPAASSEPATPAAAPTEPAFYPLDILTARDTAFILDYKNSGANELAQQHCANEPVDPPNRKADCLKKERTKFLADVIQVKKKDNGPTVLVISRRVGTNLVQVFAAQVALTEVSKHTVRIEIQKGGKGQRTLFKGASVFEVNIPNGYSIELNDPEFGRLPYDAKIGFVTD